MGFGLYSVFCIQVGRVSAVDRDSDQHSNFAYKLQSTSTEELFSVDSDTGDITTKTSLDRENLHLHQRLGLEV